MSLLDDYQFQVLSFFALSTTYCYKLNRGSRKTKWLPLMDTVHLLFCNSMCALQ